MPQQENLILLFTAKTTLQDTSFSMQLWRKPHPTPTPPPPKKKKKKNSN